jgi:hypothetical protein
MGRRQPIGGRAKVKAQLSQWCGKDKLGGGVKTKKGGGAKAEKGGGMKTKGGVKTKTSLWNKTMLLPRGYSAAGQSNSICK